MTLWMIGFLFTLGYVGWFKTDMKWYQSLGYSLLIFGMWPVFLGEQFGERTPDKTNTANKTFTGVSSASEETYSGRTGSHNGG